MAQILDSYPLSPMQLGMFFHYLSAEGLGVDIEQIVCKLHEPLQGELFQEAWQIVVDRHPALRTSFNWENREEPIQEVHEFALLTYIQEDLSGLSGDSQQELIQRFLESDRVQGFDLRQAPLSRVTVFRLDASQFVAIWTFPHIIVDGRSFPTVLREVFQVYEAKRANQLATLPPVKAYKDHIDWLSRPAANNPQGFWRNRLAGFDSPTPLPLARPGKDGSAGHRNQQKARLVQSVTQRLAEVGQHYGLTLNTFVQGAWAILLSRYSNETDVMFGAVRACRSSSVAGAADIVGLFINTVPVRIQVDPQANVLEWLKALRQDQRQVWEFEQTPLFEVKAWSDVPTSASLFDSIIIFDNYDLNALLRSQGGSWAARQFELIEKTSYPLALYGNLDQELLLTLDYQSNLLTDESAAQILGHLTTLLTSMANPLASMNNLLDCQIQDLAMLTESEQKTILQDWNATQTDYPRDCCVHELIEQQVERTPDAIALVCGEASITYRQLSERSNQLARYLHSLGIGRNQRVGLCADRSIEMMVGLLGIHKAGGAYVPLDPVFPKDRLAYMVEDAQMSLLLTQSHLAGELFSGATQLVTLDSDWPRIAQYSSEALAPTALPQDLAYVIYTSGSTGKPKGVMVEHRNVVNFFWGIGQRIPHTGQGTWLAVTSLSFDISVLELFWTLSQGFKVVLYREQHKKALSQVSSSSKNLSPTQFSLFYFASDEAENASDKYRLLLEGAKFADQHGFEAVWTPERHFHAFGGLYPNPAVSSAAIATLTQRIQIRAGSVVLPLHSPIRVAEEWALVDNLSQGRVGIAFASGWQPVDFVLRPEAYPRRHEVMYENIDLVRRLWRGETLKFPDPQGVLTDIRTLPKPVQPELPIWITAAGSTATFESAGRIGASVLTHMLGQSLEDVAKNIQVYRRAWRENGHGPGHGHITLMLHTFVGDDLDTVRNTVREPMISYLGSSLSLVRNAASAWSAFKKKEDGSTANADLDINSLSDEERRDLLAFSFERYFETSGLFGTPETCLDFVGKLQAIGVDELACLIDFGVDSETVLQHLHHLDRLRQAVVSQPPISSAQKSLPPESLPPESLGELMRQHQVTHLQCTPSMASMILMDSAARQALGSLEVIMIGGEAFPAQLASELSQVTPAQIMNMYGPTETTIWSSTESIVGRPEVMSIGRPIANTQFYILDPGQHPVPVGVVGELYIGGDGVVRGYHNRPDLTAERFLPNPFLAHPLWPQLEGGDAPARMYRTGDLARYLPGGTVEFLGRADFQVKVRGYRIELGEIEAVVRDCQGVREAVVVVREDSPGDKRLVAYCAPHPQSTLSLDPKLFVDSVRQALRQRLPEYMVPSHIVVLEALPQTPNKKIDRKALPAPSEVVSTALEVAIPQSELEVKVAAIWQEVLGIRQVGVTDNFFDLGGHSLLAVRVHRRLEDEFQRQLAVTDLFRYPTVRSLVQFLGGSDDNGHGGDNRSQDRAFSRRQGTSRRMAIRQQRLNDQEGDRE